MPSRIKRVLSLAGGLVLIIGLLALSTGVDTAIGQTSLDTDWNQGALATPAAEGWALSGTQSYQWADQEAAVGEVLSSQGTTYLWSQSLTQADDRTAERTSSL